MLSTTRRDHDILGTRHDRLRRKIGSPAATNRTDDRSKTAGYACPAAFEAKTALRPIWKDCSPTWLTHPMITSSIAAGIDPGPVDEGIQYFRRHVRRMPSGELCRRDGRPRCGWLLLYRLAPYAYPFDQLKKSDPVAIAP